jgi:hypothetical protein
VFGEDGCSSGHDAVDKRHVIDDLSQPDVNMALDPLYYNPLGLGLNVQCYFSFRY